MPIPAGPSGLPAWAPTTDRVAAYCTARTLVPQPDGSNQEQAVFSESTRPTQAQVADFIADACAWVILKCGTIADSLAGAATTTAALRAAGQVEMRYPERQSANREDAIATAKELLRQADAMRDDLAKANEVLTGQDPEDVGPFEILPVWSFPPAPSDCVTW